MGNATTAVRRAMAKNVRRLRERARMTQMRLAEIVDVDPTYIVHIENAQRNVTIDVIERIARALKTKPAGLLTVR